MDLESSEQCMIYTLSEPLLSLSLSILFLSQTVCNVLDGNPHVPGERPQIFQQ